MNKYFVVAEGLRKYRCTFFVEADSHPEAVEKAEGLPHYILDGWVPVDEYSDFMEEHWIGNVYKEGSDEFDLAVVNANLEDEDD